jgi:hypothetical protein
MTRMRALVAILGLCLVAGAAGAQDAQLLQIRDEATREMVRTFITAANTRGVPAKPLLSRALQGQAFNANAKKVEQALVRFEKNWRRSREVLGSQASSDEIVAGADALLNGVPESELAALRRTADRMPGGRRPITVEIGVLTELVAKNVSPKEAGKTVRELMARGATGAQLTELTAAVQQDVALGVSPVAALELRGKGVMSLLPPPVSSVSAQKTP